MRRDVTITYLNLCIIILAILSRKSFWFLRYLTLKISKRQGYKLLGPWAVVVFDYNRAQTLVDDLLCTVAAYDIRHVYLLHTICQLRQGCGVYEYYTREWAGSGIFVHVLALLRNYRHPVIWMVKCGVQQGSWENQRGVFRPVREDCSKHTNDIWLITLVSW